jgi:CheY-like chemotaxis protein
MTQTPLPRHLVLYADDDLDDISFVESAFYESTDNIELITALDGEDALEILNGLTQFDPDPCLIILDVNMPRLNGKETLLRIREMDRYKNTPVILFTTSSMDTDRLFAERHNAGFVVKPLDSHQMQVITNKFIDHCTDEVKKNIRKIN